MKKQLCDIAPALLHWYHSQRRVLPFRENPTPYNVWVSEIMLQQTRVAAALPYYQRFMAQLPNIAALAACDPQKLQKLWEGLGYYSRARNLQKAAIIVMQQYGGQLPADYNALKALPGIGDYTAGAIASIAFGLPCVAVDGNVLRVFSRLMACTGDVQSPAVKQALTAEVAAQQPPAEASHYNQAIMELGALVCLPKTPACGSCPLSTLCQGHKDGIAATLPRKTPKPPKAEEHLCILVVKRGNHILLQQRPPKGLLAGLWQPVVLPGKQQGNAQHWVNTHFTGATQITALPPARHVFTHKIWHMGGWVYQVPQNSPPPTGFIFASTADAQSLYPIPSAFKAYLPYILHLD